MPARPLQEVEEVVVVVVEEHRRRFPLWPGVVAYRVADSCRFLIIFLIVMMMMMFSSLSLLLMNTQCSDD